VSRVVITGSTRGIGYGLAREFLARGGAVVVNGRSAEAVDCAVRRLADDKGEAGDSRAPAHIARVIGVAGDVASYKDVSELWDSAVAELGGVDIWVNNAGLATPTRLLWEHPPELVGDVVQTNLLGVLYGCQVAIKGMIDQGYGQVFNMEGFGSTDRMRPGMTVYGSTKRAIRYVTRSLLDETRDTPVLIGTLAPGMVVTDAILGNLRGGMDRPAEVERFLNLFGERVETVAPFLVERMLVNDRTGTHIAWLTRRRALARLLSSPFRTRQVVAPGEIIDSG
jgi:NAD(P)-dependent dehydrogenase (short-subunit alcohol dehydrogenase family)